MNYFFASYGLLDKKTAARLYCRILPELWLLRLLSSTIATSLH